ncbi:MAG: DUF493 family protein [Sediminicola sp.]|tara:strand:+ start:17372 stop:17659 length:288 start_codon:yes stop_codon:yes gene_type:complete
MDTEKSDEFYKKLKAQLEETSKWPSVYLYKFIVPSKGNGIPTIHGIFDNTGAVIESKLSKNGTYTSLSITVDMENPDAVIAKYREVGTIKGVISL